MSTINKISDTNQPVLTSPDAFKMSAVFLRLPLHRKLEVAGLVGIRQDGDTARTDVEMCKEYYRRAMAAGKLRELRNAIFGLPEDTLLPITDSAQPAPVAVGGEGAWKYCAEYGWTIIANASGGDWSKETKDWQEAAAKFRDTYHACLDSERRSPQVSAKADEARGETATPRTDANEHLVKGPNVFSPYEHPVVDSGFARTLERENAQLRKEVKEWQERNGQQLAACDCAAMLDTPATHEGNKTVTRGNPFWSPAFDSVMRRTAECIDLRAQLSQAVSQRDEAKTINESVHMERVLEQRRANHAEAQLTAAQAELEGLRKDKERLDWLGSAVAEIHTPQLYDGENAHVKLETRFGEERSFVASTVRSAIDAARLSQGKQEGGVT